MRHSGGCVGVYVMCSECAFTSPVSIESDMLVMCRMQYAMSVSTML